MIQRESVGVSVLVLALTPDIEADLRRILEEDVGMSAEWQVCALIRRAAAQIRLGKPSTRELLHTLLLQTEQLREEVREALQPIERVAVIADIPPPEAPAPPVAAPPAPSAPEPPPPVSTPETKPKAVRGPMPEAHKAKIRDARLKGIEERRAHNAALDAKRPKPPAGVPSLFGGR